MLEYSHIALKQLICWCATTESWSYCGLQ